ncbi:hypothetical protein WBP06_09305 [Novosphingobium sp. BL-8H]|uniref:hypothetical protein n=1 Tax=Novosphingobium sp. BL-8H TaxID=3127640 RepID=UPI0037571E1E
MNQRIATRLYHGDRVPAYFTAKPRTRMSQIEKDPTSVIAKLRGIAAEAREPVDLIDDPENRTGWADAQPPYPVGVLFASLGCVFIAAVTLIASAVFG